jgi:hypothetical protein
MKSLDVAPVLAQPFTGMQISSTEFCENVSKEDIVPVEIDSALLASLPELWRKNTGATLVWRKHLQEWTVVTPPQTTPAGRRIRGNASETANG